MADKGNQVLGYAVDFDSHEDNLKEFTGELTMWSGNLVTEIGAGVIGPVAEYREYTPKGEEIPRRMVVLRDAVIFEPTPSKPDRGALWKADSVGITLNADLRDKFRTIPVGTLIKVRYVDKDAALNGLKRFKVFAADATHYARLLAAVDGPNG